MIKRYRISKQAVISSLLSAVILTAVLITLWLSQLFTQAADNKVELREVTIALPPPPPPPPPVQQNVVETTLTIAIQGTGAAVPKIDIQQKIDPIKPDIPPLNTQDIKWQTIEMDWDTFDLNQLDELPKLLTPLQISLPKSLSRQGINKVLIKLDILIDTNGQVSLIKIIENPYSELVSSIQELVKNSRFSTPSRDNEAVKARFIWPVEIKP